MPDPRATLAAAELLDVLVFHIESGRFCVALETVRRVFAAVQVTRVPGAPSVVTGVVDVHGSLVPVFDLRRRFGLAEREVDAADQFVLATAGAREALLHVDRVSEVVAIDPTRIDSAGPVLERAAHVAGVARLEDGLVLIHDLAGFLSEAESDDLDRALAGGAGRPQADA